VETNSEYSIRRQCRLAGVSISYNYNNPAVETERNLLRTTDWLRDKGYKIYPYLPHHMNSKEEGQVESMNITYNSLQYPFIHLATVID